MNGTKIIKETEQNETVTKTVLLSDLNIKRVSIIGSLLEEHDMKPNVSSEKLEFFKDELKVLIQKQKKAEKVKNFSEVEDLSHLVNKKKIDMHREENRVKFDYAINKVIEYYFETDEIKEKLITLE